MARQQAIALHQNNIQIETDAAVAMGHDDRLQAWWMYRTMSELLRLCQQILNKFEREKCGDQSSETFPMSSPPAVYSLIDIGIDHGVSCVILNIMIILPTGSLRLLSIYLDAVYT